MYMTCKIVKLHCRHSDELHVMMMQAESACVAFVGARSEAIGTASGDDKNIIARYADVCAAW